jgi:hypothetical protein
MVSVSIAESSQVGFGRPEKMSSITVDCGFIVSSGEPAFTLVGGEAEGAVLHRDSANPRQSAAQKYIVIRRAGRDRLWRRKCCIMLDLLYSLGSIDTDAKGIRWVAVMCGL